MSSDPSILRVLGRALPAHGQVGRAMSEAWDQDEAAAFIETLFAKHHSEIHVYLLRMVRDPELAADLTQDAFVKAYRNYDTLEKPENARVAVPDRPSRGTRRDPPAQDHPLPAVDR